MSADTEARPHPHRGPIRRTDAVLGGIAWWAVHLGGTYWLIPRTCEMGTTWPLHVLTVAMLVLIGRAWWSGVQLMRAGRIDESNGILGARRDIFLGWSGIAMSLFFGAVTLIEWSPVLFLDPCW